MKAITEVLLLILIPITNGSFGPPVDHEKLILKLFGNPCDGKKGNSGVTPTSHTRTVDCGSKTAFLIYESQIGGGFKQGWRCVGKPKVIPTIEGKPGQVSQ